MDIAHLPNKRGYIDSWKQAKALSGCQRVLDHKQGMVRTGDAVRCDFQEALHRRINSRGGLPRRYGRRDDPQHQTELKRDQRAIWDYRVFRIVQPGSGLRTAEARRIAPDVHERFRGYID